MKLKGQRWEFFSGLFLHHLAITFAFPLNHMNSWEKCLALQRGEMMWYFTRCIYCSFLILKGWAVTISSHWLWSKLQLLFLAVLAEGYCLKFGSVLNHVNLLHTCVIARIVTTNMDPRPQPQSNRQLCHPGVSVKFRATDNLSSGQSAAGVNCFYGTDLRMSSSTEGVHSGHREQWTSSALLYAPVWTQKWLWKNPLCVCRDF